MYLYDYLETQQSPNTWLSVINTWINQSILNSSFVSSLGVNSTWDINSQSIDIEYYLADKNNDELLM